MSEARHLRVLVVDDSAVARQALTTIFTNARGIHVEVAADAALAERKIRERRPDVVVLDLQMPLVSGFELLARILRTTPLPVVVCSVSTGPGSRDAMRALDEGAVDVVAKPSFADTPAARLAARELVEKVREAALANVAARGSSPLAARAAAAPQAARGAAGAPSTRFVAIGSSTGGPTALRVVMSAFGAHSPGVVVAQHMAEGFTRALAEHLDRDLAIAVREAEEGALVCDGSALILPAGQQGRVERSARGFVVRLQRDETGAIHRPSADWLLDSVAAAAGPLAAGVILTGMGRDGAAGLLRMRETGAFTIAQDAQSSAIFGMPAKAIECGAAAVVLPLAQIGPRLELWRPRTSVRGAQIPRDEASAAR